MMMIMGRFQARCGVAVGRGNGDVFLMVWSLLGAEWTEFCYAGRLWPESVAVHE